jgi:hypothetical protein
MEEVERFLSLEILISDPRVADSITCLVLKEYIEFQWIPELS